MGKLLKATFSVSFISLISRILGVCRDILIAGMFGAGTPSDIFFLCFRVPDFFRKMSSEGILNSSFVPLFSKYLASKEEKSAFEMANTVIITTLILAITATIAGMIFVPHAISILLPHLAERREEYELALLLLRIMMPYLICISILALFTGILNSLNNYVVPALAPVVFNIVIITFTIHICGFFKSPIAGVALGVTMGGIAQVVLQIPFIIKTGIFKKIRIRLSHPGVTGFIKGLFPAVAGASPFHINLLIATYSASLLGPGNISCLYYADRLIQLPMVLVSSSFAIVFLPVFSKNCRLNGKIESVEFLTRGLKSMFFIIIPAMAGLAAIREPVVKLLFFHGAFNLKAVTNTCNALLFLTFGLWAYAGSRMIVPFYYAYSDMGTPLKAGLGSIIINILVSLPLMAFFELNGIALAVSISGGVNFIFLLVKLNSMVSLGLKDIGFSACRAIFISGIMFIAIKVFNNLLEYMPGHGIPLLINVAMSVIIGVSIYFGINILINNPEIRIVAKVFKK